MTIAQLKSAADTAIRNKVSASSISPANVADQINNLADELLARGIGIVADTSALAALSGLNFKLALLPGTGFFQWLASGSANGVTIFAASGGGVWSLVSSDRKVVEASGSTALFNLTAADSGKWFTNEGASEDVIYNLPAASPGLIFYAAGAGPTAMHFVATAGNTIQLGSFTSPANGRLVGGNGSSMGLLAVNTSLWMVIFQVNTWNVE